MQNEIESENNWSCTPYSLFTMVERSLSLHATPSDVSTFSLNGATIGETMIWHTFDDGRRTVRRRLGHIGTVVGKTGATPHYCLVVDECNGRVRVGMRPDFEMPTKFILRHAGREARYKVVRRNGRLVCAERVSRVKQLGTCK